MSTEIDNPPMSMKVVLDSGQYDVLVVTDNLSGRASARVPRADFLAAVETECGVRMVPADAIVIDRAELPGVDLTSDGQPWAYGQTTQSAEKGRAVALAFLALAEYRDANPPVDEADVEALAGLLSHVLPSLASFDAYARRLLATGRVSVTR